MPRGLELGRSALAAEIEGSWRELAEPLFAAPWSWFGADELVADARMALDRCVGRARESCPEPEGRQVSVTPPGLDDFSDLLDLEGLDGLLRARHVAPFTFESLRPLDSPDHRSDAAGHHRDRWIESGHAVAELAAGAAVVINDAQELCRPLRRFCDLLAVELGRGATVDVHAAMAPCPGLTDHAAVDDAFVLQVAGTTRWSISDDGSAAAPTGSASPTGGAGAFEVELEAGQCLTIPRWTTCSARNGPGLTLSIVVWLDGRATGSAVPTRPSERYWVGDGQPFASSLRNLVDARGLTSEAAVARPSGVVAWTMVADGRLVLRTCQRQLVVPARLAGWVHHLLAGPPVVVGSLAASDRQRFDALALVQRLVAEGILTPV